MMILSSGTVFGQETLPVQETASADAEQQAEIDGQAAETSGEPDPSVDGEWEGDGEDWQYRLTDGTCHQKELVVLRRLLVLFQQQRIYADRC